MNRTVAVLLSVLFLLPITTEAASLYIDPARSELYRGDSVVLNVRLNVDRDAGECVNTIDAVLNYPDSLDPVAVSVGDSIVSLWPEKPKINRDNNTITLAGGIPNGYCGRVDGDPRLTNNIVKLVFRLPGFAIGAGGSDLSATATVSFAEQTTVYLNDGRGTRIAPTTYPATIALNREASTNLQNEWQQSIDSDDIPPEPFSIALSKNPAGKYIVSVNTTDKQTGIEEYQIMEEPLDQFGSFAWGRADAPWITMERPENYILRDQSLNSIIRVQAIDKAGNQTLATLVPDESMRTLSGTAIVFYVAIAGVLVLLITFGVLGMLFWRRRKNKAQTAAEIDAPLDNDNHNEYDR